MKTTSGAKKLVCVPNDILFALCAALVYVCTVWTLRLSDGGLGLAVSGGVVRGPFLPPPAEDDLSFGGVESFVGETCLRITGYSQLSFFTCFTTVTF